MRMCKGTHASRALQADERTNRERCEQNGQHACIHLCTRRHETRRAFALRLIATPFLGAALAPRWRCRAHIFPCPRLFARSLASSLSRASFPPFSFSSLHYFLADLVLSLPSSFPRDSVTCISRKTPSPLGRAAVGSHAHLAQSAFSALTEEVSQGRRPGCGKEGLERGDAPLQR